VGPKALLTVNLNVCCYSVALMQPAVRFPLPAHPNFPFVKSSYATLVTNLYTFKFGVRGVAELIAAEMISITTHQLL
jgi:hypothetical protein